MCADVRAYVRCVRGCVNSVSCVVCACVRAICFRVLLYVSRVLCVVCVCVYLSEGVAPIAGVVVFAPRVLSGERLVARTRVRRNTRKDVDTHTYTD